MNLAIQGSRNFDDYAIFLRAVGTAMYDMEKNEDKEITIFSVGPRRVNNMAMEFSNVSEASLKARGIRIRLRKVTTDWVRENIEDIDYFVYLSKPREPLSDLVSFAEDKEVEVGVYRY